MARRAGEVGGDENHGGGVLGIKCHVVSQQGCSISCNQSVQAARGFALLQVGWCKIHAWLMWPDLVVLSQMKSKVFSQKEPAFISGRLAGVNI